MPARLLYFVNIPRFFVTHRLPLALAAREAGYEVHVASSMDDSANIERIRAAGLPFHPLPLRQHSTQPWQELATLNSVTRLYRRLRPDLVHQVAIKAVVYGGLAARLSGVAAEVNALSGLGHIFTADGLKAATLRTGLHAAFRLALGHPNSRTIFQNPDDRDLFLRAGLLKADRAVVIRGSGVDLQRFVPQPEAPGLPVILYAGRLIWPKGIGDFVEAARRLQGKARFAIAGIAEPDNPAAVPLDQLASWQQQGLIDWLGHHEDMPQVLAQAHIVCLPSAYGEGVPRVLIEAAACARPIVSTDTPGCREITRQEENGLLLPPHDVDGLCQALERLIGDAELRQRFGAAGRRIAEAEFSLQQVNRETLALYATLLANKTPRTSQ